MIRIHYSYGTDEYSLYVKCEFLNLTGSIKDRMVLYVLEQAFMQGQLTTGQTIIEASSGNTGISLAAIGTYLGCRVNIVMPDWLSRERISIISALGAKVKLVSKEGGGFLGSIEYAYHMSRRLPDVFFPKQFENFNNIESHRRTTGKEILDQLSNNGLTADAFVAGVGTGGTVMGIGSALKEYHSGVLIKAVEPHESPTLSTGYQTGCHRIQGISDEFVPALINFNSIDGIIQVHDGDAILMAQSVANDLGLGVGISAGANIIGAIMTQLELGKQSIVVTVIPDSNKKYLSTDLMRVEKIKKTYITPKVKLLNYTAC